MSYRQSFLAALAPETLKDDYLEHQVEKFRSLQESRVGRDFLPVNRSGFPTEATARRWKQLSQDPTHIARGYSTDIPRIQEDGGCDQL